MLYFFFFKQQTAYEVRISDWSSDVCSSDLNPDPMARSRRRSLAFGTGTPTWGVHAPRYRNLRRCQPRTTRPCDAAALSALSVARRAGGSDGDRKSVVEGTRVSVRVDHGGARRLKKKNCMIVNITHNT